MNCLFRNDSTSKDGGFVLLEVAVCTSLSIMLLALSLHCLFSLWVGADLLRGRADDDAMWVEVQHTLARDVHAATNLSEHAGQLSVQLANRESYRYLRNQSGQLVRIGEEGGTSVLAVHIQDVAWQVSGQDSLEVIVTFEDGSAYEEHITSLTGVSS